MRAFRALLLGGSWVVISGVTSPLIWVISIFTLRTIPIITTHEPPSTQERFLRQGIETKAAGQRRSASAPQIW